MVSIYIQRSSSWFRGCRMGDGWDLVCSRPLTARSRIWWTDIDYSRSRTTSILKKLKKKPRASAWSSVQHSLCLMALKMCLIFTIFWQRSGKCFSCFLHKRADLQPQTFCPGFWQETCIVSPTMIFFLFFLRIIIFIFVLSALVLSGIATQVGKCSVAWWLKAFLQWLTLVFPGLAGHSFLQ